MKKVLLILLFIPMIAIACQSTAKTIPTLEDTATFEPPTDTPTALPPTHTSLPDTSTPLPPTPSPTQTPIPPSETPTPSIDDLILTIQPFLEEQADNGLLSGSVLIAKNGIPVFQKAYGLADLDLEIPNQVDTKFNLGSMDKMFTAVAIMQLVESGKLSLNETIGSYLPDYHNPEIASNVTIHQLLTHTSGLGNYFDSPAYLDIHNRIRSLDDYFSLFADTPLLFPPGSQFGYSNSGYIVLGMIIEAVSGTSYYDYVQEHIFEPRGMQDTACYELDAGIPNLASGYTTWDWDGNDTGQLNDNLSMLPIRGGSAGGGYSTAPDLLSFSSALFNHQLLSPESTELLIKGKIQIADGVQYAYGFFDRTVQGYRMVGHGGGFPGICSLLGIYPEVEITIIILTNSDGGCVEVNEFITEVLLK